MTVLEHIKQLALNLTPEEKDALAQYLAESLAQVLVTMAVNPGAFLRARLHDRRFQLCVNVEAVAIQGDTLIAHGANPREVYLAAREAGITTPFIERVEKRQDAFMGGWL